MRVSGSPVLQCIDIGINWYQLLAPVLRGDEMHSDPHQARTVPGCAHAYCTSPSGVVSEGQWSWPGAVPDSQSPGGDHVASLNVQTFTSALASIPTYNLSSVRKGCPGEAKHGRELARPTDNAI